MNKKIDFKHNKRIFPGKLYEQKKFKNKIKEPVIKHSKEPEFAKLTYPFI